MIVILTAVVSYNMIWSSMHTGNFKFVVSSICKTAMTVFKFARWNCQEVLDIPNPYSIDLRWRIVWIYLTQNLSTAEITSLVGVSESVASP